MADDAARFILKGVKKNEAQIIFPTHGRSLVHSYRFLSGISSSFHQVALKVYRGITAISNVVTAGGYSRACRITSRMALMVGPDSGSHNLR